jgi:hypothetical protein
MNMMMMMMMMRRVEEEFAKAITLNVTQVFNGQHDK